MPDAAHAAADEAPRAERHVLQLVRRGQRRGAHDLARGRQTASTRSSPASTTAGSAPRCSVVQSADRGAAPLAARLFDRMRWDMFYDADTAHPGVRPGGLIHGGFYDAPPTARVLDLHRQPHRRAARTSGTPTTTTTRRCPRPGSRSYLGILTGQIPAKQYFAMWRTFPASCDWSWHEMQPVGENRTYLGRRRLRGRLHLPRHAHRPGLGRQHVRGAHARRVRPGVELGAAQLGRQPPAARPGPA